MSTAANQGAQMLESYMSTLDQLAGQRNESDADYDTYMKHLGEFDNLVPKLGDINLVHKSLQRFSDSIFKQKVPLSNLIRALNVCFDHYPIQ